MVNPIGIKEAQERLDAYNARYPNQRRYVLRRVSRFHGTAHVVWEDSSMTSCGTRLHRGHEAAPDENSRLCDRCRQQLRRRF